MSSGRYESSAATNIGTAITFLLIGLGAGALAGLLLAPKTGKQLRRDLQRGYEDAKDSFDDWADEAKDRVREVGDRVRDVAAKARTSPTTFVSAPSPCARRSREANQFKAFTTKDTKFHEGSVKQRPPSCNSVSFVVFAFLGRRCLLEDTGEETFYVSEEAAALGFGFFFFIFVRRRWSLDDRIDMNGNFR